MSIQKVHTYTIHSAKGASLKLDEILAKARGKTQTKVETLKFKPVNHPRSDINNARNVLDKLMNYSAKPGKSSVEAVTSKVEV